VNGDSVDGAAAISEGYHDIDGQWHPVTPEVRARLAAIIGVAHQPRPLWFISVGSTHSLLGPCELIVEGGESWGVVDAIDSSVPMGYHDLAPVDGGPVTRLVVHPTTCPPLATTWGVAAQTYALWSDHSWGIGDLHDVATLAQRIADAGGGALLLSPMHQAAPTTPRQDSPYYPSTRRARDPLLIAMGTPPPAHLRCTPEALIDRDAVWAAKRAALWHQFDSFPQTSGTAPAPSAIAWWNARCERPDAEPDELIHVARFHDWLQARIDAQLAEVTATGVAVVGDLAVGFAPDGADATDYAALLALDVRVGAPPDAFNAGGQEWGIPPFIPWKLRAALYEPFIHTIRAAMRGVQGLRIDHVMGLFRQYWVPAGGSPRDGAYVRYPADELLAIICLEATRAGAFVVGEDLGTVEPEVREALAACGIAGTRVLWFEPQPPAQWPKHALATITTHDLPTIAGVFARDAVDPLRGRLEQVAPGAADARAATTAVHTALIASSSALRLLASDDLAGAVHQPNVPGTVGPPNWCRLLPVPVDQLL
jgi:4-alpha-glucanotransferase